MKLGVRTMEAMPSMLTFLAIPERTQRQKCKVCACPDKFNFHVPDAIWKLVVPARYQNKVVCLDCFDDFALEQQIDYANSIEVLYFAGDRAVFKFQTVSAQNV